MVEVEGFGGARLATAIAAQEAKLYGAGDQLRAGLDVAEMPIKILTLLAALILVLDDGTSEKPCVKGAR